MSHQSDQRHCSDFIPTRGQKDDTSLVKLAARTSHSRSSSRSLHRRNSNDYCPSAWPCWVSHFCLRDASVLMSWPVNFRRHAAIAFSTRTRCHQILQLPGKAQREPREPLQQRGSRQVDRSTCEVYHITRLRVVPFRRLATGKCPGGNNGQRRPGRTSLSQCRSGRFRRSGFVLIHRLGLPVGHRMEK